MDKNRIHNMKPNPITQPIHHKQWQIIGLINETVDKKLKHQKSASQFRTISKMFFKNIPGTLGFCLMILLVLMIIIIPETTSYDPTIVDLDNRNVLPFDSLHFLGTTERGIDIWAQLWHGSRYSLGLAITAAVLVFGIGSVLGLLMGYFRRFDKVMMYFVLILQNIPTLPLLIVLILLFGPNFGVIVLSFGLTSWIGLALQVRSQIIRGKSFEWVKASKVLGTGSFRIIRNLIPRAIPIMVTVMILAVPGFILGEITLSVLGLTSPNQVSLGNMINQSLSFFLSDPGKIAIPATVLTLLTTSMLLVGNGILDTLRRTR